MKLVLGPDFPEAPPKGEHNYIACAILEAHAIWSFRGLADEDATELRTFLPSFPHP